jgi:hypothetical protein
MGIVDNFQFTNISDDNLRQKISEICISLHSSGERMVLGTLKSCGIIVPRWRVRKALHCQSVVLCDGVQDYKGDHIMCQDP